MNRITLLIAILLLLPVSQASAAPKADLWERWSAQDPQSDQRIDHRAWGQLLRKYLYVGGDAVHRFAYGKVDDADRGNLDAYVDSLAQIPISSYNRNVQRAYWINLYNALTVQEVLRHFPVGSIRDISSGLFSAGPWNKELVRVEGEDLTLNDIEHRILRPIWRDPRIHYAVNCASIGCPNLRRRVYTGSTTETMLDRAARDFINHPRAAAMVNGKLRVSSIYDWFVEDFGGNDAGVIAHLRQYASGELAEALRSVNKIDDDQYDWRINSLDQIK